MLALRLLVLVLVGTDTIVLSFGNVFLLGVASRPDRGFLPVQEYAQLFLAAGVVLFLFCALALYSLLRKRWRAYATISLWAGAAGCGFAYAVFADTRPTWIVALGALSVLFGVATFPLMRARRPAP